MLVDWLSFIALLAYAFLTYLIAKDIYNPLVSFNLHPYLQSHLNFGMVNKSKVEVEVFGKVWANVLGKTFEFKEGFYGDKKHWILQPFTEGFGHFDLKDLENKEGVKIEDFMRKNNAPSIKFNMQIKYRRTTLKEGIYGKLLKGKWKITSPQNFIYDLDKNLWWLNV